VSRQSYWLIFLILGLILSFSSKAEENFTLEEGESLPRSEMSRAHHTEIEKVLSSEDFARKKDVTRWRLKNIDDKETRDESFPEWMIDAVEIMEGGSGFFSGLAAVLEVLLWLSLAILVILVFVKYREQVGDFFAGLGQDEVEAELPTMMFGLDVKKTSQPKDVVKAARQHWLNGEQRQSIGLLLQASLIALLHDHGCRFFDSDTESECCERIEQQAPNTVSAYMLTLVSAWQQVAYAHRAPSDSEFDGLCQQWREVF